MVVERTLSAEDSERLAALRRSASDQLRTLTIKLSNEAPNNPLDALAWVAGAEGPLPDDPSRLKAGIDRARADRYSWREISDALGEGSTQKDARRVRERHRSWNRS